MREKSIEEKLTKAVQQNGYLVYSYKPCRRQREKPTSGSSPN